MNGFCFDCNEFVPLDDEGCCKHCGGANVRLDEDEPEYPQPLDWFFLIPLDAPKTKFPDQGRAWLP